MSENKTKIEVIEVEVENDDYVNKIKTSFNHIVNHAKDSFTKWSQQEKVQDVTKKVKETSNQVVSTIDEKISDVLNDERVSDGIDKVKETTLHYTAKALDEIDKAISKRKG